MSDLTTITMSKTFETNALKGKSLAAGMKLRIAELGKQRPDNPPKECRGVFISINREFDVIFILSANWPPGAPTGPHN